uniref:Very-long-chain 3-oxoacyl-CoA synthase n=1 Tax=Heterorhabditis bacteriophora TaxID=37862 RepID=A0A1I7WRE5_HETBA
MDLDQRGFTFLEADQMRTLHRDQEKSISEYIILQSLPSESSFGIQACYSVVFTAYVTFSGQHSPMAMSSKLLVIAWAVQAIVSMGFLVYWQLYGHMKSYHKHVVACQHGAGLKQGKYILKIIYIYIYIYLPPKNGIVF